MLDENQSNNTIGLMDISDFRAGIHDAIIEQLSQNPGSFDVAFSRTLNQILIVIHWFVVQFVGTFMCVAVMKVKQDIQLLDVDTVISTTIDCF